MRYKYILFLACLNVGYILIGGVLFKYLEQEHAKETIEDIIELKDKFLGNNYR